MKRKKKRAVPLTRFSGTSLRRPVPTCVVCTYVGILRKEAETRLIAPQFFSSYPSHATRANDRAFILYKLS